MSDYELEPMEPREPEIEYEAALAQEGSYRTGSTTPPKDYGWVIASVLVTLIFFSGLSTALSVMNIRLFADSRDRVETPVTFVAGGSVSAGLEVTAPTGVAETQPTNLGDAMLKISDARPAVENIPEEGALSWQQVYARTIDSLVSITCVIDGSVSSGSGVVMSRAGYIITNAHVVDGADSIVVLLTDGRTLSAAVVGSDGVSDLAVLAVDARDLTPAEFGDSDSLRVGDAVVAIGDPLGAELRGTMTDGIISGINRDITVGGRTMTLVQTTAALNNGNSGGPLVNCYGQVIGINTMKIGDYASQAGVEGLGFAIPMSTVKDVVDQLVAHGYVAGRPTLGIKGEMVSSFYQYYYRLPKGMMITSIEPTADAYVKGLSVGDIILYADGRQIGDTDTFSEVVNSHQVGDSVTVVVYRAGREYTLDLTVGEVKN